jgi:hypothetical protein
VQRGASLTDHSHVWLPFLLVVAVSANHFWLGRRWPTPAQGFRLLVSVVGIVGAAPVWWEAACRKGDMGAWAQVLGALAIGLLAAESAWKELVEIVRRSRKPPPPRPGATEHPTG